MRNKTKITITQLAEKTNIKQPQLTLYENNKMELKEEKCLNILVHGFDMKPSEANDLIQNYKANNAILKMSEEGKKGFFGDNNKGHINFNMNTGKTVNQTIYKGIDKEIIDAMINKSAEDKEMFLMVMKSKEEEKKLLLRLLKHKEEQEEFKLLKGLKGKTLGELLVAGKIKTKKKSRTKKHN